MGGGGSGIGLCGRQCPCPLGVLLLTALISITVTTKHALTIPTVITDVNITSVSANVGFVLSGET